MSLSSDSNVHSNLILGRKFDGTRRDGRLDRALPLESIAAGGASPVAKPQKAHCCRLSHLVITFFRLNSLAHYESRHRSNQHNNTNPNRKTMKTLSVLISLAAATAVNAAEETATSGSIRASRSSARGDVNVQYPVEKKKEKRVLNDKQRKMHKDAYDRHLTKKTGKSDAVPKEENNQERELSGGNYKAKSGFSKLMWQDDGYRAGGRIFGRNDDKPGWFDDDDGRWGGKLIIFVCLLILTPRVELTLLASSYIFSGNMRDDDRGAKPGRSKDWGWMGGGSGKSGKSGGRYPSQDNWMGGGSGKSGKSGSPEYWGGSGKSGKSGGSGGGHNGLCQVTGKFTQSIKDFAYMPTI